ncbi:unnamed protein product, partial [Discosporangium mesarthrocarpum]
MEIHTSVIPDDPTMTQVKVYGDLPELHVYLSQGKLERLSRMLIALKVQSKAALQASVAKGGRGIAGLGAGVQFGTEREGGGEGVAQAGLAPASLSGLSSFLDFQQSLSHRLDHLMHSRDPGGLGSSSGNNKSDPLSAGWATASALSSPWDRGWGRSCESSSSWQTSRSGPPSAGGASVFGENSRGEARGRVGGEGGTTPSVRSSL